MYCKFAFATLAVLIGNEFAVAQQQIPSTTTAAELWNPWTWFWPYAIAAAEGYRDYFQKAQKATNELYQQAEKTNAFPWITGKPSAPQGNQGGQNNQGGNTQPNQGGNTQPNQGGNTQPNQGGNTQPNQGGNTQPNQGGNTQPNQGGNTQPNQGGNTQPNQGGNTQPNQGGNTQPNQGGNTQPNQGGSTQPNQGGNTQNEGASDGVPQQQSSQDGTDGPEVQVQGNAEDGNAGVDVNGKTEN